ncbi:hypothetical protein BU14_0207s0007 [Porphyra umbilicalis]|uniref:Uncharacterized protein n=1 Tax=Porphyra umbilicalis TaxID=2786 RepID=A0A1X6P5H6_PORUM|nr:hypothetical protein BU14_0207s0007 [Porphyra umbilicalis]|eukprot:OSX76088.1 hypothetical protein BU14_0207s0007 [Porphyra umbilicalis]
MCGAKTARAHQRGWVAVGEDAPPLTARPSDGVCGDGITRKEKNTIVLLLAGPIGRHRTTVTATATARGRRRPTQSGIRRTVAPVSGF